jgi:catechol 2,3-dioxygenase-like lactoylglutathione lyase family enzyme
VTRREWLCAAALTVGWRRLAGTEGREMRKATEAIDHLLLGAPDLDAAIDWFEAHTGVRATLGGSHPGMGTRNALVSLGAARYLEIIAPDPAQSAYGFHIDVRTLPAPRLVTWAASTPSADSLAAAARAVHLEVFGPADGSRARPDGTTLRWRTVGVRTELASPGADPVPFFIEWAPATRHPSGDSPSGCRLVSLELTHPDPARLRDILAALGIDAAIAKAPAPAIRAVLETPKGRVQI